MVMHMTEIVWIWSVLKTLLSGRKTIQNGETITVYYDVDVIGPDEIPDKYQVEVVFTAVNGTVDGQTQIEKVFNLKKGDEYAEDGVMS